MRKPLYTTQKLQTVTDNVEEGFLIFCRQFHTLSALTVMVVNKLRCIRAVPNVCVFSRGLDLNDTIVSLDGVYDSRANRKAIFNRGMIPNIPENPRGRTTPKRGRKPVFDQVLYEERFFTIERVFGWEDKFKRLLLRFFEDQCVALCLEKPGLHDAQSPAFLQELIFSASILPEVLIQET